ncbi:hypothetical protein QTH90_12220 [Variovorax sp. J2P1-59]|uniref:hypothetical protein n=1 Tax=Variovorax flavidus TaxID=3053501 RepID=UPI0025779D9E|nr:hypothetical protein [Variovorax sp. J2P1-59]MDM0075154.1 hypothetical protein [Variovorax sp. J2P1-59]
MPTKTYVVCPGGVTTGGPEVLHQLVSELREAGRDAYICYFPFGKAFDVPPEYRKYNVLQSKIEDEPENLVILPESGTKISRRIRRASVAIWWLSVDNYYALPNILSFVPDALTRMVGGLLVRRPLRLLRPFRHFAQSQYAIEHLRERGIDAEFLGDYLNRAHASLPVKSDEGRRINAIAYNPKKGAQVTRQLIAQCPEWQFVPISGLSASEVNDLLSSTMLYIDFGHHPGRDRLPREAALAGCCVITGRKGAAENSVDIAIPEEYKIDETAPDFVQKFKRVASGVFGEFSNQSERFESYRKSISGDRLRFTAGVSRLFT